MFDWLFSTSCQHKWKETKRTFHPPHSRVKVKGIDEETMLQLAYGITVIELKCEVCREIKHYREIGNI